MTNIDKKTANRIVRHLEALQRLIELSPFARGFAGYDGDKKDQLLNDIFDLRQYKPEK